MIKTIDECFSLIQNGANIKQGDVDGGFPITRIETITNDKFSRDRMGYAGITDISKYTSYLLEDGDLLMSHINSVQYLGRTVLYVKQSDETIIHGMNLLRLKARRDVINPAYAKYCFYGHPFRSQIRKITKKSVNQASFAVKDLKQIKLNIPALSEQNEIVMILDKIQQVLAHRIDELSKLDDLIKARFVEMFGDSVSNEKGWKVDTVESLCKEIYGGGTPSKAHPEYYEDGDIPWVSSKDMKTDLLTDSLIRINQLGVDNSTARMVPINSVIMVIRSGILKHTLPVAINAVPITVNKDLKVFIPGEKILARFLAVQFKMHEKDILSGVRAVTADNIEFNSLRKRKMIVPPIELQQKYVSLLEQVDKSKFINQLL
ncbi:restriction endonuclease subunit S [Blautia sp.]|uniref:restriction endonuclease subunit S n=1 Tax=Blautia sp. TaxID=1955243 RepID=UPI003AF5E6D9